MTSRRRPHTRRHPHRPAASPVCLDDLPKPGTLRWTPNRKAAVVAGVRNGLLTDTQACLIYGISDEEFRGWCRAIERDGIKALQVTSRAALEARRDALVREQMA